VFITEEHLNIKVNKEKVYVMKNKRYYIGSN